MDFPENAFWDFSVRVHQTPGVHEACLEMQTKYGLDVNLLFICCWVAERGGGSLDRERIEAAMAAVDGWQEEIVRPIWRARWCLKPSYKRFPKQWTEPLRQTLVKAELDAEHIEQLQLAESVKLTPQKNQSADDRAAQAVANLFAYLAVFSETRRIQLNRNGISKPLVTLVSACFPSLNSSSMRSLIESNAARIGI